MDRCKLVRSFQSLGGAGRGAEFAAFQQRVGIEPQGLLAWADLGADLLIGALEHRFDGVGYPENTIVFTPDHSDEWWTKDRRYWMAMRSFLKTSVTDADQAALAACQRLQSLRLTMIEDLTAGDHIFVFRDMHRNLSEIEVRRLHAAIRAYGDTTLFYVQYADEAHPPCTVVAREPGLLIGYIDHFSFSSNDRPIGSADEAWLALCEKAALLHSRCPTSSTGGSGALAEKAVRADAPAETQQLNSTAGRIQNGIDPVLPQTNRLSSMPHAAPYQAIRRGQACPGRKIVLIGNCQMQAMAGLYKRFVAGRSGDVVEHVPSYQDLTDEHRDAIQHADIVVEQLFDLKPQADTQAVQTTTPRIFIPMVTAAFLWPFAGSPHPKNVGLPFLAGGPYGGEAADSYLNRSIVSGIDPEEAVMAYLNLDVNSRVNLDRLFEIVIDRQRSRDEAADYNIADIMQQHFRTEQIFLSPYHPNVRIATELAGRFFEQLGAQRDEIERMRECTRRTPFPKGELPIHPSVCRHFGLEYIAPDRRYRFMNEGLFTFREYALRYMRYEWNDALEEGMHLAQAGKTIEAQERLSEAVARSPHSAAAHSALGHILNRQGARDAAIAASQRAVELEPEEASYRANLGSMLAHAHRSDAALVELRSAVAADPVEPHYRILLAHQLRQFGKHEEACRLSREAIRLDPYSADLRAQLSSFLEANSDPANAVVALQDAVALDPANEAMHHRLAQLLARLNRFDEAIETARTAVRLAPQSTKAHVTLSDVLLRKGDAAEALSEAYVVAVHEPNSALAYGHLGHVLYVMKDFSAAEAAFRRAVGLDPTNAHLRHEVSMVLLRQQRIAEAISAAKEATELEPKNPHRFVHLATLHAQHGEYATAQATQRRAVELGPEVVALRVGLSDLFARDGQLDEAFNEASIAVASHPNSVHALGHLAHVAELKGELEQAEKSLQRAIEIEPGNETLRHRAASLKTRKEQAVAAV